MPTTTDQRVTIDIDTGGTFTDGVVNADGQTWPIKVLTTPHDLTVALRELIDEAAGRVGVEQEELLRRVESIRYSTTLGTNTVIERSGPRIGVLAGPSAARAVRALQPGDLVADVLDPLEWHVREVTLTGDDDADREPVLQAVEELLQRGAERLVVVLPDEGGAGEEAVRRIVLGEYPRHILGALPVLFSSELDADTDVGRRVATAVLNAYLHPQLETFLYEAESVLRARGLHKPLFVFCNDGTTNRVAKVTALKTHNSGPAGGVEAARALARHYGFARVATIDIGGTSTDVAFLADAGIEESRRGAVDGTELSLPMRRIDALGGGGGTIAEVADGVLQLGPRSAGAAPGPASFGFGGTEATVTDANLVLGVFDPGQRFAGRVALDPDRARRAVDEHVATPLGLTTEAAAHAIREALERRIGDHLRAGFDERSSSGQAVLIAFGGGGAVHAARIAEHAGIDRVLVPGLASVCSAFGIGFADVEHRYTRLVAAGDEAGLERAEEELARRARIDMRGEGFSLDDVTFTAARSTVEEGTVEVALVARAALPHIGFPEQERPTEPPAPASTREVFWDGERPTPTPVFAAEAVEATRARIAGPAIVAGDIVTVCVPPGWTLERDQHDQSFLTREA
ncbi:hydantoinase/oxoprolinase family protein [Conexibacter sp. SYSU D00693]|uniref:hydantoinase/oxoprolinase family protein n=1 Tax=Conexibacter sp. SYSU D00693 TaxID=2812560 RepID=UPI00196A8F3B|nr:hydantoinase/oxoprolinase family protein [Conexibacter sp. SYSU D00693]